MVVFRLTYPNRAATNDSAHDLTTGDMDVIDVMDRNHQFKLNENIWIIPGTYNFD